MSHRSGSGFSRFAETDLGRLNVTDEPVRTARPIASVADQPEDDDVIGEVGDGDPGLLPVTEVSAVCRSMAGPIPWPMFHKQGFILTFTVVEPNAYTGLKLRMFIRWNPVWKQKDKPINRSSKLYQSACVALARRLDRYEKIRKSFFIGKTFRCSLGTVDKGFASYTIIESITEKLTG